MKPALSSQAESLWRILQAAERRKVRTPHLDARLSRLATLSPVGSDAWAYAQLTLAQRSLHEQTWRAALLLRQLVTALPDHAEGWALLGLALTILGNPNSAARSYRQALRFDPSNAVVCHNLGHLYDICLGRSQDALKLLIAAYRGLAGQRDVAASLALALVHVGAPEEARELMAPLLRDAGSAEEQALHRLILKSCAAAPRPGASRARQRRIRRSCTTQPS